MRKHIRLAAIAGAAILLGAGQGALADDAAHSSGMVLLPSDAAVHWAPAPASLPKGTQLAVLAGDPAKPGPFVLRVLFPAHTTVAPHTHSTAENLTVISGSLMHAMGPTLERSRGQQLAAGGFVYLPGAMPHSVWTTAEPAEVQVTGTGPFGLNYINPTEDPSRPQ